MTASAPTLALVPAMALIPASWFEMGCATGQDNERPVHGVWVDAFQIALRQVTNADYAGFLAETSTPAPPFWTDPNFCDPQQPVVAVSWFDSVAYCEWLAARTGQPFRLPTEAEWERAARGGVEQKLYPWGDVEQKLYPWGDTLPQDLPDYAARCLRWATGPERVGLAAPNPFGIFNLCDNVHEWCSDWFAADYYAQSPERNPPGPEQGERRSSRGGSWRHHIKMSRCAARSSIPPQFQYADYGFRVAADVVRVY